MDIFKALKIEKKFSNHLALDNLSVSVPEGSIYGLLGPNGAGKTTLIRIINQITAPDKGELFFYDRKFRSNDVFQIGYLPEERGLYRKMKVGEQAVYLSRLKGVSKHDAVKRLKYWFEKFEMQAWWNKKVEELSKGMQQKVQFIVTVLHKPKLLIFDEPFSGFDPINVNLLKEEILKLRDDGATIIFSTHNMSSVEELCDHIALINNSKTILSGEIFDIINSFKSNIFEVNYKAPKELLMAPNDFEIVSTFKTNGTYSSRIKIRNNKSSNELLQQIIPQVEVVGYKEVLPTINDIFIQEVNKSKNV